MTIPLLLHLTEYPSSLVSASSLDQFNTSIYQVTITLPQVKHKQQWRTNAPATPSPSFKPPTGISSPGAAQTATPVPSWLSGGARSVATVAATRATPQRHENGILPGQSGHQTKLTNDLRYLWRTGCDVRSTAT